MERLMQDRSILGISRSVRREYRVETVSPICVTVNVLFFNDFVQSVEELSAIRVKFSDWIQYTIILFCCQAIKRIIVANTSCVVSAK